MVEHWSEKPGVDSSILSLATIYQKKPGSDSEPGFFRLFIRGSSKSAAEPVLAATAADPFLQVLDDFFECLDYAAALKRNL